MKLSYYYKRAVLYPSLFILFFSLIYASIANYKGQGNTDYSAITIAMGTTLLFALLMSILSLGIFLNKISKLRTNITWNILTWFLLPIIYLTTVFVHDLNIRTKYDFGFGDDFLFLMVMTIPFVIGLYRSFIKYRGKIRSASNLKD